MATKKGGGRNERDAKSGHYVNKGTEKKRLSKTVTEPRTARKPAKKAR